MKNVTIEFSNIQSHEKTQFTLSPGLNFILADDNNVGKSTIFKILLYMAKMPKVDLAESNELLRVGCQQGYAAFAFDDWKVILWLIRDGPARVYSFFEIYPGAGSSIRETQCPKSLLEALDLVIGVDSLPINLTDADSVQLVVDDTPKNDQVFSQVLVDARVEEIKQNIVNLTRQVAQDYQVTRAQYEDAEKIVQGLSYNLEVDNFKREKAKLAVTCSFLDEIGDIDLTPVDSGRLLTDEQLRKLSAMDEVLRAISDMPTAIFSVPNRDFKTQDRKLKACGELCSFCSDVATPLERLQRKTSSLTNEVVSKLEQLLNLASLLQGIVKHLLSIQTYNIRIEIFEQEERRVFEQLQLACPKVNCPIKGEVYYSEHECVSCSDGPPR